MEEIVKMRVGDLDELCDKLGLADICDYCNPDLHYSNLEQDEADDYSDEIFAEGFNLGSKCVHAVEDENEDVWYFEFKIADATSWKEREYYSSRISAVMDIEVLVSVYKDLKKYISEKLGYDYFCDYKRVKNARTLQEQAF
ncbi:hypothetical protein CFTD6783_06235 [Campylobacter fetus subsp. testudinum]|uniref:hypothetical protein n=1 Tax=Campylobacter fetus TaxID=196 RepID=UPI0008188775|nr:hypothetical protein [Campylobacter fetus]OCS09720.1 hypothetical protein CFTD6783_06235 [Campylobacter fetus subsp. testudinum]